MGALVHKSLIACAFAFALLNLLPAPSAHPQDMQNSFVEFKNEKQTTTYDLRTVEVIQPGKFVIVETVLKDPDVMRFELKVLDILRSHCSRPMGSYPAPTELFSLRPPDKPVKEIEVELQTPMPGTNYRYKIVSWNYHSYRCNPPEHPETEEYREHRNVILNGIKNKVLFDCNRSLVGEFWDEDENDYRKARVHPVHNGTVGERYYYGVCRAVTGKDPYLSE
jgi:hypothetical protein